MQPLKALWWDDHDARGTQALARRRIYHYNGSTTKCAKLHMEYTEAAGGTDRMFTLF